MDREMKNIKPRDVYGLVSRASGMRTFRLGEYSIGNSRTEFSRRIRADSLLEATTSALKSTMVSHSRPSCASHLCAPYSPSGHSRPRRHTVRHHVDLLARDPQGGGLHGAARGIYCMNERTRESIEASPPVDNTKSGTGSTSVTREQDLRGLAKHRVVYDPVTNQFCSESNGYGAVMLSVPRHLNSPFSLPKHSRVQHGRSHTSSLIVYMILISACH